MFRLPSVEAGMVYVAEFLVRHNGNIGRCHTTDVNRQSTIKILTQQFQELLIVLNKYENIAFYYFIHSLYY